MNDDWFVTIGRNSIPESANKLNQSYRWFWDTEVRPGGEMEMSDDS